MNKQKRDMLLLGVSLLQLKQLYKVNPKDIIKDYDEKKINELWDKYFPEAKPTTEDLKLLAVKSYRDALKVKNTINKK